jgi:hypothetical protein
LSNPNYQRIHSQVKKWLEEEVVYEITPWKNPKTHFSFHVRSKSKNDRPPIMFTYPKKFKIKDTIIIGCGWIFDDVDQKGFRAVKDRQLKMKLFRSVKVKVEPKVKLELIANNYNLERMNAYRFIRIDELTKDNVILNLGLLVLVWENIKEEFKNQNESGSFNALDNI